MFLYSLGCSGKESSIKDCPSAAFSRFWRRRCLGGRRTAGVVCFPARRRNWKNRNRRNRKSKSKTRRWQKTTVASTSSAASTTVSEEPTTTTSTFVSNLRSTSTLASKDTTTLSSPPTYTTTLKSASKIRSTMTSTSTRQPPITSTSTFSYTSTLGTSSTSTPTTISASTLTSTSPSKPVVTSTSTSTTPVPTTETSTTHHANPTTHIDYNTETTLDSGRSSESATYSATTNAIEQDGAESVFTAVNDTVEPVEPSSSSSVVPSVEIGAEYRPLAPGVKSDSPHASIDYGMPFNMVAGGPQVKKDKGKLSLGVKKYTKDHAGVLLADAPKKQVCLLSSSLFFVIEITCKQPGYLVDGEVHYVCLWKRKKEEE